MSMPSAARAKQTSIGQRVDEAIRTNMEASGYGQ